MSKTTAALWLALMALFTAGCGSDEQSSEPITPYTLTADNGLTSESEPTAELAATDATAASNLAGEVFQGTEEAAQVGQLTGAQGEVQPASAGERTTAQSALDTRAMATRSITYTCAQFLGAGASGTILYSFPDTAPTAGWESSLTLKDCSYSFGTRAYTVNGAMLYEYLRYVSGSDFGFVGRSQDLQISTSRNGQLVSTVQYSLSHAFDIHNGVITNTYATSRAVFKSLKVTASNNQLVINVSAVIDMNERRGVVRIGLSNWKYDLSTARVIGGSAIITGANNTRAEVVASTTGYTVTYTDSTGKKTVYTFIYPS
jgi:hypothetical protein